MTNQEVYNELKGLREDFKNYLCKQERINDLVIRHDEKIKGVWKIPVISGSIVTFITGVGVFAAKFIK